ncbi:MAG: hypothetical protein DRP63_00700 [Planctomycetota bacterium]|nr:MAG: hypothetical protein DRP63_00700 [Planctomycetota bacterium]
MRIVVAGGGSGGHLIPLLAVVERLRQRGDLDVVVVCGRREAETQAVRLFGARTLHIGGDGRTRIRRLMQMFSPLLDARLLRRVAECAAVLTSGSYAAVAPTLAALLMRRPVFAVEPNAVPGRFTRFFAPVFRAVFRGWSGASLGRQEVVTGVPLRRQMVRLGRVKARWRLGIPQGATVLLVLGGSQGSCALNGFAMWLAPQLLRIFPKLFVLHAAGAQFEKVQAAYRRSAVACIVSRFCGRIWEWYSAADAVLCRAGASTCAEVATFGLPAVFVPHPGALEHQRFNAEAALQETKGTIVAQCRLAVDGFAAVVKALRVRKPKPCSRHLKAAATIAEKMMGTLYGGVAA